ncbi:MAG TPA: PAS domain S-box protein [Anaerolineae bacterium]|nr:PAS domain S-box protein [Anaerolineae bacterium]HQI83506.1 PAS domain S-box protein [Anaerolineae bacterium]
MRNRKRPPWWSVLLIHASLLALSSIVIVWLNLPDSLLLLFLAPCVLLAFFYGWQVCGAMLALLVAAAVWVAALVSSNFVASLITFGMAALSGSAMAWGVHTLALAQVQAEEKCHAEHERLINILWGTGVGAWEWNVQTGETHFDDRWAEMIGYTLEEISPVSIKTWEKFTHPGDFARSNEALERYFRGETPCYECDCRMRHKNGHWVWVLDRGKVVTWTADGKPLWMAGTHLDITERKQTEEALARYRNHLEELVQARTAELEREIAEREHIQNALRESEFRFRAIYDTANVLIIAHNTEGKVIYMNPYACRILGYQEDELLGQRIHPLFEESEMEKARPLTARLMADCGFQVEGFEQYLLTREGQRILISWNVTALQDTAGNITGILGVGQDITARA